MAVRVRRGWFVVLILIASCTAAGTESQATPAVPTSLAVNPNLPLTISPAPFPYWSPIPTTIPALILSATSTSSPLLTATSTPTAASSCGEPKGALSARSFDSTTFHRKVEYSLYLPPCYGFDASHIYPVLYLLHGARADHTQWPDLNVAPNADLLIGQKRVAPFVVVMPDGDYRPGEDYAVFVLSDLLPHIEATLHVGSDRTQRAIGGLSAGGDWALQLALTHPELFSAVGAHSAVAGEAPKLLGAAAQHSLRFYLDVGSDDPLRPGMVGLAAALQAKGFASIFHVYAGGHDRPYWRSHSIEYLSFYAVYW